MYYGPHLQVLLTSILVYSVSDLSHFDVDPEPVPKIHIWEKWIRIHLSVIVDPDPRIHIWKNWIRIRVPIFHIFHKEIYVGQIKMLISLDSLGRAASP